MSVIKVISTKKKLRALKVCQLRNIINGASQKQGKQQKIEEVTDGFDNYYKNWRGSTRYWYYVPNKAILILNVWDTYCYVVWVASSESGTIRTLFQRVFSDFSNRTFYLHVDTSTRGTAHAIYQHYGFNNISELYAPPNIQGAGEGTLMSRSPGLPLPPRLLPPPPERAELSSDPPQLPQMPLLKM